MYSFINVQIYSFLQLIYIQKFVLKNRVDPNPTQKIQNLTENRSELEIFKANLTTTEKIRAIMTSSEVNRGSGRVQ